MAAVLTTIGEEYLVKNNIDGASLEVGLYDDSTDEASDSFDLADLTTEPEGSAYDRQTFSAQVKENASSNWEFNNPSAISYDTSDSSQSVDAYFIVANFTSTTADDGSATDHIIATGNLSQTRNLTDIDTLELGAEGVGAEID